MLRHWLLGIGKGIQPEETWSDYPHNLFFGDPAEPGETPEMNPS